MTTNTISIKNLFLSNAPLKVISFILGYSSWYLLGTAHTHTIWKTIPLSFYDVPQQHTVNAPESVTILLSGKRAHLRNLNEKHLAAHINGHDLKQGTHPITLTTQELFLPDSIKLVHYTPTTILIEVT